MSSATSSPRSLSRRDFIKIAGGLATLGISSLILAPRPTFASVLPPGAVHPPEFFHALCVRCGRCNAVCPHHAIRQDNVGLPYIDGLSGWCDLCMDCVKVCPTGALQDIDPKGIKLGLAVIDRNQCLAWKWQGCRLCYEKCLNLQKAIRLDADFQVHVEQDLCNGCGACINVCPQPATARGSKSAGRAVALSGVQRGF